MWFETFLKERYQYTIIKEYSSDKIVATHGVSQGSVHWDPYYSYFLLTSGIKQS